MEIQGCCKGGKRDADYKSFAMKHAGMTFSYKAALLHTVESMMNPKLNDDGAITVTCVGFLNGVHSGMPQLSCCVIRKLKQPFCVSKTYCGCCAGYYQFHYQYALRVKLRLKGIVSYPLDSNGDNLCYFTFEIIDLSIVACYCLQDIVYIKNNGRGFIRDRCVSLV